MVRTVWNRLGWVEDRFPGHSGSPITLCSLCGPPLRRVTPGTRRHAAATEKSERRRYAFEGLQKARRADRNRPFRSPPVWIRVKSAPDVSHGYPAGPKTAFWIELTIEHVLQDRYSSSLRSTSRRASVVPRDGLVSCGKGNVIGSKNRSPPWIVSAGLIGILIRKLDLIRIFLSIHPDGLTSLEWVIPVVVGVHDCGDAVDERS